MYLTFLHISGASHEIKFNNISWDILQKCLDFTDLHSKSGKSANCQSLVKDLVWNLSLLVEIVTSLCKLIVLQKGAC